MNICTFIPYSWLILLKNILPHTSQASSLTHKIISICKGQESEKLKIPDSNSVQFSLSCVRLFATPWTAAQQASLSITNSQSLLKLMSLDSVMPSNHLILCHPLLLPPSICPSIRALSDESILHIGGQSIGVSASASFLPMNIQD